MAFQIARSVISGLPPPYADAAESFRQARLKHRFTGDVAPSAPAIIEQAADIAARKQVVQRHGAELEVAVDEFTDATTLGWMPAEFAA
jgi:hypothetical protein